MKRSRKAEKRQKRKERKLLKLNELLSEEKIKFDVLDLLCNSNLDTKPNLAKFLKERVLAIRCHIMNGKILTYPKYNYELSRIFVKFLDSHELIYDMQTDGKISPKFYMCYKLDEIELTKNLQDVIDSFFLKLILFDFVK